MKPKFEIGEECWLVSNEPHLKWVRVAVTNRRYGNWWGCDDFSRHTLWCYTLDIENPASRPGLEAWWAEDSLRKINPDTNETCEEGWGLEKLKSKEKEYE